MTEVPRFYPDTSALRQTFQKRVLAWLMECFSMEVCRDGTERNHRFLEESLELVQSLGCTPSEAHQLVDYVFGRPVGEPMQELGGVQVTLAALCFPHDLNMEAAAETELARVWTKIDKIRAKQAAKPKHSPLPQPVSVAQRPIMPIAAALARRLCQLFDSGGESQRSVRARHASAIFHLLNSDRPEYLAEQQKCDANPVKYLKDVEWDGLDCACGGGWKIGHASGCPEADTADTSLALPSTEQK